MTERVTVHSGEADTRFGGDPAVSNSSGEGGWTEGDPFLGVVSNYCWSADEDTASLAWVVGMGTGLVDVDVKTLSNFVWPVRSGQ